jgi:outer membrane protein OmpA-like peptidoglycan-associated protein
VIAVVLVLFMGAVLVLAGLWYAAQKIKAKAHAVAAQVLSAAAAASPSSSAASPGGEPGSTTASAPLPPPAASSFPTWTPTPSSALQSVGGGPAPLKVGMLVVTAVADVRGDYESLKQIQSIDGSGTTLSYHSEGPKPATGTQGASAGTQAVSISRKVLPQDLRSAHEYAEVFGSTDPQSYPGTTAISASQDVLAELKEKGTTQFSFRPDGLKGALGSLMSKFSALAGANNKDVGGVSLDKFSKEQCSLQREGNGLFAFPVLLNAQPMTLPALRADCMTDDGPADFYILDQPDYPLMLSWKLGSGSQLQVIKIAYPPPPAAPKSESKPAPSAIEQQLKEKKKVDIYGIYFDFASDRLKPESTPVLEEIAGVLKDNPDWKLTVSGHTDNVGGDVYNLDLSKRRAAAVKEALLTQYHVAPDRLSTDGFGASRPVDTNDTLAGRARNRRVELTRE